MNREIILIVTFLGALFLIAGTSCEAPLDSPASCKDVVFPDPDDYYIISCPRVDHDLILDGSRVVCRCPKQKPANDEWGMPGKIQTKKEGNQ